MWLSGGIGGRGSKFFVGITREGEMVIRVENKGRFVVGVLLKSSFLLSEMARDYLNKNYKNFSGRRNEG